MINTVYIETCVSYVIPVYNLSISGISFKSNPKIIHDKGDKLQDIFLSNKGGG